MSLLNPEIAAPARDLDRLARSGPPVVELEQAREVLRAASDVVARSGGPGAPWPDAERALTLARLALDRARAAQGGPPAAKPSWQQALQAPRPPAGTPVRAESDRHATVQLDSEIPDAHPAKTAIESSIAGAFAGVKGRWRVAILVQPNAPWWGIRVEGRSICWTGTLEGADEQSPEFLAGRIREAVQLGLMQAALPRERGRG
jgi:hypothetical protein